MRKAFRISFFVVLCMLCCAADSAWAKTIVFWQPRFPSADSSAPNEAALRSAFANAEFDSVDRLADALAQADANLLVMPYGSAYPESQWPAILRYLDRGGNLIVLGGKAFTRAAWLDGSSWRLRGPSVAESLELFIHDYQETPGSGGLTFAPNEDVFPQLPSFGWKKAFSPVLRLSVIEKYHRQGSTGNQDADLTTLAWGERDGHKLAAPVFEIDHNRYRFVGGRWIFVACEPDADFYSNTKLLSKLADLAVRRSDRFTFRPRLPLFLPGEALEFHSIPADPLTPQPVGDQLHIRVTAEEGGKPYETTIPAEDAHAITLPSVAESGYGLHTVEATLLRDGKPLRIYRSGFWMRDWQYLLSGPKLTAGTDYFKLNGKPLPVVGTTYMSSDVQRLYLVKPNAYVWCRDLSGIQRDGLDMIRTGLWSAWQPELAPDGEMSEEGLRAVEAFLMCARRANLPVQFNLFAFLPDSMGGVNPYLDPVALRAQSLYVNSLVRRFHNIPFLAWDLINEPKASWKPGRNGDAFERVAWRKWLDKRYPNQAALLSVWAEPAFGIGRQIQPQSVSIPPEIAAANPVALPRPGAFGADSMRKGYNPLKVYDYDLFTQSIFANWVRQMRDLIRSSGSSQLVAVGQGQNGSENGLSPAFYSPLVDFTADHTWWDFDSILWGSLSPKFPGKPMLIQETGEQRRLDPDGHLHLSAQEDGWQLERKIAIAFAQGAGAIEWLWNVNSYMPNDNEIPIGAIRPDGTEKPEARVLEGYAAFIAKSPASFTHIEPPAVTIVTSQAVMYSGMHILALDAQKRALRALAYYDHTPLRMLPENQLFELGNPKLVILPSPQALTNIAWRQLMEYVAKGGTLLITGPVGRDEHWQPVNRLTALQVEAQILPLDVRQSVLDLPGIKPVQISFPADAQESFVDVLRFADGECLEAIRHGGGHILWERDPVEFSEDYEPTAALYRYALDYAGIKPPFLELTPLSPGVLAFPTVLDNAVLYSFSNESLDAQTVNLMDAVSGAHIHFTIAAQRGAMLLIGRNGVALASYGGASMEGKQGGVSGAY